jgi:hypothetical protein
MMNNSIVHNCKGYGIAGHNSSITLDSCQITNCLSDCLLADGGIVNVNHTTLAQFYPFSAQRGAALRFGTGRHGIEFYSFRSLVTGYEVDVVFGEKTDTTLTYAFYFEDCLLRTDSVNKPECFKNIIWETPKDTVQGKQHFRRIDEQNYYYDFRLDSISPAFKRLIGRIKDE